MKRSRVSLAVWIQLAWPLHSHAEPMGGKVVSGQAVIQQATQAGQSVTTITQTSPKATLNWQSFNVGSGEAVRFVQPSASALSINRISDPNGSKILGKLSANGQVWLINPAGVFFGPGAQVNVGGLVASTLNLADSANPYKMQGPVSAGNNTASVTNQGSIQTSEGGYVALLGANVGNTGDITSAGERLQRHLYQRYDHLNQHQWQTDTAVWPRLGQRQHQRSRFRLLRECAIVFGRRCKFLHATRQQCRQPEKLPSHYQPWQPRQHHWHRFARHERQPDDQLCPGCRHRCQRHHILVHQRHTTRLPSFLKALGLRCIADHGRASQTTKPNLAELASDSRGPGPTNGRQVCHSAVRLAKHRHYSQALDPCTPVPGLNWSGNSNNQQLDLSKT